jgi:Zn-dependent peptidase ImmA (M78 family)
MGLNSCLQVGVGFCCYASIKVCILVGKKWIYTRVINYFRLELQYIFYRCYVHIIAINSNMSYGRQRFTAAHESYHLFFEKELRNVICEKDISESKSESEKEADTFASYLLAPYDSLRGYLEENNMLDKPVLTIEDTINMEQFYQLSHQAMIYRLVYDKYLDWNESNNLKMAVSQKAIRLGYDDKLYKATVEEKKYFSIGEYVQKVEALKERDFISNGKYEELLLDGFRADIVYNLGSEGAELND